MYKLYEEERVRAIADAIREKAGTSDKMTIADMAQAISDIPAGGGGNVEEIVSGVKIVETSGKKSFEPVDIDLSGVRLIPSYAYQRLSSGVPPYDNSFTEEGNIDRSYNYLPYIGSVSIDDVAYIGSYAFAFQEKLTIGSLPEKIKRISDNAFKSCSLLALTSIPDGVTIGQAAFQDCKSLKIKELPAGVTLSGTCFRGCSGITEMDVKATLKAYGSVFLNCTGLQTLKIRGASCGISSPNNMFKGCTALVNVWVSSSCATIEATNASYAPFSGCSKLTDIYCEAPSAPSGFGNYWNYTGNATQATVHWGVSESDFDAIVGGNA